MNLYSLKQKSTLGICVFFSFMLLSACFKNSEQSLSSVDQTLFLQGQVMGLDDSPMSGIEVKVEQDPRAVFTTAEDGRFTIRLTELDLKRIRAELTGQRRSFFVYVSESSGEKASATQSISVDAIGNVDLGVIRIAEMGGYSGEVLRADLGKVVAPASNTEVRIGPSTAMTDESGKFKFENLPSGRLPISIRAPGLQSFSGEVNVVGKQSEVREAPIVLFSGVGPEGLLVERKDTNIEELVKSGHSTAKHFRVFKTETARFIRFHHIPERIELQPENFIPAQTNAQQGVSNTSIGNVPPLPWVLASETIDYDFPTNGGQVLFYQFADFTRTRFSPIFQVGVDVDIFSDSNGFVDDSESVLENSFVEMNIEQPAAAISMRTAEAEALLADTPWQPISDKVSHNFLPVIPASQEAGSGEPIRRALFLQFRDAFGRESQVFTKIVQLNLFEDFTISVNDGNPVANGATVPVSFSTNTMPRYVRTAVTPELLNQSVWEDAVSTTVNHRFFPILDTNTGLPAIDGQRSVCTQLKDKNGFVSEAKCSSLIVEIFPQNTLGGFTINGGAAVVPSRLVNIDLQLPPNAVEMRVFENLGTLVANSSNARTFNWLAAQPFTTYIFPTPGSKVLYLQYRDLSGFVSGVIERPVVVLPIAEAYAGTNFTINNGANLTTDSRLQLNITGLPFSASAMAYDVKDQNNPGTAREFEPISNVAFINIQVPGRKTVNLQFRNNDGELSPTISRVIDYDPFPPSLVSISVNGGAATTNSKNLTLNFTAPQNTVGMRFALTAEGVNANAFQSFKNSTTFELPPTIGDYRIFYQFVSLNGDQSLVFSSSTIRFDPFPGSSLGAVLNNGNANATTNSLSLHIDAQAGSAVEMRLAEDATTLSSASYLPFQADSTFDLTNADGTYTVFVQLRSVDGIESPIFTSNSVTIDVP